MIKPIRFEKGSNGNFRVSVNAFPEVFGVGHTEIEAIETFMDEYEDWGQFNQKTFSKWYKRNSRELRRWANEDGIIAFSVVDYPISFEDYVLSRNEESSESSQSSQSSQSSVQSSQTQS